MLTIIFDAVFIYVSFKDITVKNLLVNNVLLNILELEQSSYKYYNKIIAFRLEKVG